MWYPCFATYQIIFFIPTFIINKLHGIHLQDNRTPHSNKKTHFEKSTRPSPLSSNRIWFAPLKLIFVSFLPIWFSNNISLKPCSSNKYIITIMITVAIIRDHCSSFLLLLSIIIISTKRYSYKWFTTSTTLNHLLITTIAFAYKYNFFLKGFYIVFINFKRIA